MIDDKLHLVYLKKIWEWAPHAALTDLVRFQNQWFCTFRESDKHVQGQDGAVRILTSKDGRSWDSIAYFQERGVDLRDPKLSVTPDGRLMLLVGALVGKEIHSKVCFSYAGQTFSPWQPVLEQHEWLWRVTWHQNKAWGISYRWIGTKEPVATLWSSENGVDYIKVADLNVPGYPSEGTLRFLSDNKMVVLLRRDMRQNNTAWIGSSEPPYTTWNWVDTGMHVGGPNFIALPDQSMWAAGRLLQFNPYGIFEKVAIFKMGLDGLKPLVLLPSGGDDTSYPGMVYHDGRLAISYYSSHEGTTAIYFAELA